MHRSPGSRRAWGRWTAACRRFRSASTPPRRVPRRRWNTSRGRPSQRRVLARRVDAIERLLGGKATGRQLTAPVRVVVDLQALQVAGFADRGIGRYVAAYSDALGRNRSRRRRAARPRAAAGRQPAVVTVDGRARALRQPRLRPEAGGVGRAPRAPRDGTVSPLRPERPHGAGAVSALGGDGPPSRGALVRPDPTARPAPLPAHPRARRPLPGPGGRGWRPPISSWPSRSTPGARPSSSWGAHRAAS